MTLFAPASLPGLVVHTMRIAWRTTGTGGMRRVILAVVLLSLFLFAGVSVAMMARNVPIGPSPAGLTIMSLAVLVMLTFGISQSLSRAEHALYGSGDLDLLLGAPIATRTVLWSKLVGIAASVLLSEGFFILPILLPMIVLGHPALAGALVLLVALVLVATCLGLAVMLVIVRLSGPRAARTVAQVTIALFGGAMVIASQVMRYGGAAGGRNGFGLVFGWASAHHFGQAGWGSLPGRAGFGDPLAGAGVIVGALVLFVVTGMLFERHFVVAFQQAGHHGRLRPRRPARAGLRAHFSASLARTLLGKEMALLRRNPQILATMLLRLVYLVPMLLVLLQHQTRGVVLPAMAFVGVFVTTQLTGDLAWLVISGEDTPDLLAVAPIARAMIGRTKAAVAVAMAAPLLGAVALGIGSRAPVLVLVIVPIGLAGSAAAASIQLRLERPSPRKAFGRRTRGASIAANLLVLLVALTLGGISAGTTWWLTMR